MTDLSIQVLQIFGEMGTHRLDLHVLFEAAGNEPSEREKVLLIVEKLRRDGLVESCGGDFYSLTEKGERAVAEEHRLSPN